MADDEDVTYTVGELNRHIRQALDRRFPEEVWVEGEMRGKKRHLGSGNVYFELIDPSADGRQADAVIQVALYNSDKVGVNRLLKRAGAVTMDDGVHIRIRGSLAYQPAQGRLQFRMRWIDPAYTLGRLEAERQRLIDALTTEGLLGRNAAVPFPLLPLRIGLITSPGSAAHHDFLHELEASGHAWRITLVAASVQGPAAPGELVAALAACAAAGVDVVAIVRGGGARTDLAAFDSEHLARAIAALPIPVVTGIGHETDHAVADLVAARRAKTPTACAALLVREVDAAQERALRAWNAIAARAVARLDRRHDRLDRLVRQVSFAALRHLDRQESTIELAQARTGRAATRGPVVAAASVDRVGAAIAAGARRQVDRSAAAAADHRRRLVNEAPRIVARRDAEIAARAARVAVADPARLLARGWTITRTIDGTAVTRAGAVRAGEQLVTTTADGSLHSTVTRVDLAGSGDGADHSRPTETEDTT